MSKVAVWFDIPTTNITRAKQFYSDVFDFSFEDMEMNGMKMAMVKGKETDTCGMLVQGEKLRAINGGVSGLFWC